MKLSILISLFAISINAFSLEISEFKPKEVNKIKAIVMVLHGLNLNPVKMDAISTVLLEENYLVLRGSLEGHYGPIERSYVTTRETWLNDVTLFYEKANELSVRYQVPLYFVGYSLGGLIFNDFLNQRENIQVDKMVLIAPGIWVTTYVKLSGYLSWLLGKSFVIKSENLKEYRFHPGTSLSSYDALLSSREALLKSLMKNSNIETLLFLNQKDEVISYSETKMMLKELSLSKWKIEEVNTDDREVKTYNHLFIDEKTMGINQWMLFKNKLLTFFN